MEIINNFLIATTILSVVAILYAFFVLAHPYSVKAKAEIKSPLVGCMIEAFMWFIFALGAITLASENPKLATVFGQVVGTFPIVTLSLIVVPMTFSMYNSSKRYKNYRWYAIIFFFIVALLLGAYYWFTI